MENINQKTTNELLIGAAKLIENAEPVTFDDIENGVIGKYGFPVTGSSRDEFMDDCEDLFYIMQEIFNRMHNN